MVPKESKAVVKGEYGSTPAEIKDDIIKKILGDEKRITHRPADDIEPELDKVKAQMAQYLEKPEDVLTWAMFPQVAEKYFKKRFDEHHQIDSSVGSVDQAYQPV